MFCPRCDTDNPPGIPVCRSCGSTLQQGTMVMAVSPLALRPKVFVRVVRADGGPEAVVPMRGDVLAAGKTADVSLPDDPFVAPQQVRFFFSGARLAVEDVGGGNGVFFRLRSEKDLPTGGELRLGRQRLICEPIPQMSPAAGGTLVWGAPDAGYRFRLIQVLEGGIRGAAFPLKDGDNSLGREVGDIAFPSDGFVSGRHAVLKVTPDKVVVKDVGSSNGTFIRLGAPTFVENGDQFLIGRQLLRVELQAAG